MNRVRQAAITENRPHRLCRSAAPTQPIGATLSSLRCIARGAHRTKCSIEDASDECRRPRLKCDDADRPLAPGALHEIGDFAHQPRPLSLGTGSELGVWLVAWRRQRGTASLFSFCLFLLFPSLTRNVSSFTSPPTHFISHLLKALPLICCQDLLQALVSLLPNFVDTRL